MIADLLTRSQQSHTQARTARRQGRTDDAFAAIRDALALRTQAHEQDPDHLDQAWTAEAAKGFIHLELLIFYRAELAKDADRIRAQAKARLAAGQRVVQETQEQIEAFRGGAVADSNR